MKNFDFWLQKKWLGALLFVLFCLGYSLYASVEVNKVVTDFMPVIKTNAADFLPITIEDGMIVKPENTLIEKSYGDDSGKLKIVLDTRTEEFEPSTLTESGIYISRAAVYSVNTNKNEVRINSLHDIPNMVIDEDVLNTVVAAAESYIKPVVFGCVFAFCFGWGLIVLGIYSLVLHWIMSAIYKAPYRQTLRLTVYAYVLFKLIEMAVVFSGTFLGGFIFAAVINFAVNMVLKRKEPIEKTA